MDSLLEPVELNRETALALDEIALVAQPLEIGITTEQCG